MKFGQNQCPGCCDSGSVGLGFRRVWGFGFRRFRVLGLGGSRVDDFGFRSV